MNGLVRIVLAVAFTAAFTPSAQAGACSTTVECHQECGFVHCHVDAYSGIEICQVGCELVCEQTSCQPSEGPGGGDVDDDYFDDVSDCIARSQTTAERLACYAQIQPPR